MKRSAEDIKKYGRSFGDMGHKNSMPFQEESSRLFTMALMEYLIEVRMRACGAPLASMKASFSSMPDSPGMIATADAHFLTRAGSSVDPDLRTVHTATANVYTCRSVRRSWLCTWVCP
jgi:hypothetical protein